MSSRATSSSVPRQILVGILARNITVANAKKTAMTVAVVAAAVYRVLEEISPEVVVQVIQPTGRRRPAPSTRKRS